MSKILNIKYKIKKEGKKREEKGRDLADQGIIWADIQAAFMSWSACVNSDSETNGWFYLASA